MIWNNFFIARINAFNVKNMLFTFFILNSILSCSNSTITQKGNSDSSKEQISGLEFNCHKILEKKYNYTNKDPDDIFYNAISVNIKYTNYIISQILNLSNSRIFISFQLPNKFDINEEVENAISDLFPLRCWNINVITNINNKNDIVIFENCGRYEHCKYSLIYLNGVEYLSTIEDESQSTTHMLKNLLLINSKNGRIEFSTELTYQQHVDDEFGRYLNYSNTYDTLFFYGYETNKNGLNRNTNFSKKF